MKTLTSIILAAMLATACACQAKDSALSERITQQDGWVAWQVPMAAGAGTPCCCDWHQHRGAASTCDLDGRSWNISTSDNDPGPSAAGDLAVYAHVSQAKIDKVRAFASTCPVRDADRVRRLDAVAPADSIALLAGIAAEANKHDEDVALAALALHEDAAATPTLEHLADASHPRHLREQALFWLAQARGAEGAQIVRRAATSDADADLRANAIFALSQSHAIDAYAAIHAMAQHDASDHVREQALFWMAQMRDPRAKNDILAAIRSDASAHVREQGVFALSQLKDADADAALIALVRGNYPREVKQQALFWLGQSGSDAAIRFIDEVLTRRPTSAANG